MGSAETPPRRLRPKLVEGGNDDIVEDGSVVKWLAANARLTQKRLQTLESKVACLPEQFLVLKQELASALVQVLKETDFVTSRELQERRKKDFAEMRDMLQLHTDALEARFGLLERQTIVKEGMRRRMENVFTRLRDVEEEVQSFREFLDGGAAPDGGGADFWPDGDTTAWHSGDMVRLEGLNRAELNGSIGELVEYDPTKERWQVQVNRRVLLLKEMNLIPLAEPTVTSAAADSGRLRDTVGGGWRQ